MSRLRSLVLIVVASCSGGSERHDSSTPAEATPTCPSDAVPELCQELAQTADSAGKHELAWAYTVLECESPQATHCSAMWERYSKRAPTQTDALSVLHSACTRAPTACKELAYWHRERGHTLAAAIYEKRVSSAMPRDAAGLAAELAGVMHVSGAPRTDTIAQMIGHEMPAPVIHTVVKPAAKARAMHSAALATSSDNCTATALLDRHQVSLDQCIGEVRPIDGEKIALRNRCNRAITVSYVGARADRSTYVNQLKLEAYEALSIDVTHDQVGELTFAACPDDCRATSNPDELSSPWKGAEGIYYCSGGTRH